MNRAYATDFQVKSQQFSQIDTIKLPNVIHYFLPIISQLNRKLLKYQQN